MTPKTAKPYSDKLKAPSYQPEKWLLDRITNTARNPPHYEASLYGPYNALLCHYFPYQRKFLVKPQPKLWFARNLDAVDYVPRTIIEGYVDSISHTSTGIPVNGQGIVEFGFLESDFVVAKATESRSSDRSLLHVEIKLNDVKTVWQLAKSQLIEYMETTVDGEQNPISGLLICGAQVEIYQMKTLADEVKLVGRHCSINSKPLWDFLHPSIGRIGL